MVSTKRCFVALLTFAVSCLFTGGVTAFAQVSWTKYEDNPLETTSGFSVLLDNGIYKTFYFWIDQFNTGRIGYSTSPDGITWTKGDSDSIFPLGDEGAWDEISIEVFDVLHVDGVYHMWFLGDNGEKFRIGYASSADGITWEKYPGNPVLDLGEEGSWDGEEVMHPCVIHNEDGFHMWYNGYGQSQQRTGYATSPDGITWDKYSGNPVLTLGEDGSWEDDKLILMGAVYHDNTYHMWYSASDGTEDEGKYLRIGYAISPDGIHWNKYSENPVLDVGDADAWDSDGVATASVVYDSILGIYKMWFLGMRDHVIKMGYATSPADQLTDIENTSGNKPERFRLGRNFPNPFNNRTSIQFRISDASMVELSVHNALGQQVRTLIREFKSPGTYNVVWDGKDNEGRLVNSGMYLYRMTTGEHTQTNKLLFLK